MLVTKEKPLKNQAIFWDFSKRRANFFKFKVVTLLKIEIVLFFWRREMVSALSIVRCIWLKQKFEIMAACVQMFLNERRTQVRQLDRSSSEEASVWATKRGQRSEEQSRHHLFTGLGSRNRFLLKEKRAITAEQMWKLLSGKITITREVLNVDLFSDFVSVSLS